MPKLYLTLKAESDLDAINEHYSVKMGPAGGVDAVLSIIETLETLETLPHAGQAGRLPDTRELILSRYPFLAAYRVKQDRVEVLRILHQHSERFSDW